MFKRAVWQGLLSGAAGVVVMTLGEKAEQRLTGRPDSHVPARVLERLFGAAEQPRRQPLPVNWAKHFGQGALIGVLRSVMANEGLRGPVASAMFTVVRLTAASASASAYDQEQLSADWVRSNEEHVTGLGQVFETARPVYLDVVIMDLAMPIVHGAPATP